MTGDWMNFGLLRRQHARSKGRHRRPGKEGELISLLALSAGWLLAILAILHAAGLAYLPLDAR